MKWKFLLLGLSLVTMQSAFAATGLAEGSKYGSGEDSIRCLENLSLYSQYYKMKDYTSAYQYWKVVYEECPKAGGRTLYANGAFLIANRLVAETDAAKKQAVFDELMACYDQRMKYFGNDKNYPESWIKGRKAVDYLKFSTDAEAYKTVLPWLTESVEDRKEMSDADVLNAYFFQLEKQYQSDKAKYAESFIDDYLRVGGYVDQRVAAADKYQEAFKQVRDNIDQVFVASGAADCATLDKVFAAKVEAEKDNSEALSMVIKLFRKAKCQESEVYFQASIYAHKLNPTAETAAGCAYQSFKKNEYADAIRLFEEAITLSDNNSDKYEYSYTVAALNQKIGSYSAARQAARRALEFEANHGEPYILIAQLYADSKIYPDDPILSKTVFWAAVDKLEKAKSVDPNCAARAQQLINSYKKYYPTKEDVFFKPELKPGAAFLIGGWIGESVICRD
ncbi:MAG: hypothetical protein J5808_04370 [Paludibacteraceae bacterium]|nr:hypothetical protein [Paludibacteraceae bacterium]